ncbi:hypothetical protein CF327_g379 [Tilletia walkeri]|nr:hypothetical protein CF327_g379 [Tilletia walkeri]
MIPTSKPVARPVRREPVEDAPPPKPSSPNHNSPPTNNTRGSQPQRLAGTTQAIASPGSGKTIWQSWLSLRPSVRMAVGISFAAFAVLGMAASDKLQTSYPAPGSPEQSPAAAEGGEQHRPRKFGIRVLDRVPPAAEGAGPGEGLASSTTAAAR